MKTGESFNECGTEISNHICDICGKHFTVCPKIDDSNKWWNNCLGLECASYNPLRDANKFFGDYSNVKVEIVPTGRFN